jgi:diacylglycerol kinase family enzyme
MKNFSGPIKTAIGIIPKGSAENTATNIGMNNLIEVCYLYRRIANGTLGIEDLLRKIDIIKVTFDDDKVQYGISSFNIGMVSHVAHGAESDSYSFPESFFRRHRMKIMAYGTQAVKAAFTYKPFKVEVTYNLADGTGESYTLDKILDINVINGKKHAAIPDWNPHGDPCDGVMEVCGYENPNFFHIVKLVAKMLLSNNYSHLTTRKNGNGYNVHGIHYERDVRSLEIRILNKGPLYVELGATTWPIEKPESIIRAEIVPEALNFVCMNNDSLPQRS